MIFVMLLEALLGFTLGLPRMLALFSMLPIFSKQILPGSARNAVAISMSLFIFPTFAQSLELGSMNVLLYGGLVIKEIVIGLLMGFGLSVLFHAVGAMGFLIDNQRGSTMASSVDPMTGSQTSPLGLFMTQVLATFFMVSGAAFVVLFAVYQSYALIPVGAFLPDFGSDGVAFFLGIMDQLMVLAVLMAAPAMIAMFLSELGLGLVSRFAPQLNVFFLAMPVKSAVGILLLALYISLLPDVWSAAVALAPSRVSLLGQLVQ